MSDRDRSEPSDATVRPSVPDPSTAIRAALDVLLFAPLGLGAKIVDDAPGAVKRARQELSNARFIGKMTVDQGVAQMRRRATESATPSTETDAVVPETDPPVVTPPDESSSEPDPSDAVDADDLALPDYDQLPAIDIVAKLDNLTVEERADVERYEVANRRRRTVLGKLAQLADE